MTLKGRLVQVARPATVNSLADGAVGVAWTVAIEGINEVEAMYRLQPESPGDQEKVEGLLFAEGELEEMRQGFRHGHWGML